MKALHFTPRFYVAAALVIFTVLLGVIGPFVVSVDPKATIGGLYDAPSGAPGMLLGTDNAGQSVSSQLVYGVRTSLYVGLLAGLIASAIGMAVGLLAGYKGGLVDDILSGLTNVALSIPTIVVVILLGIALSTRTSLTLALIIGITAWPWTARAVRAQATSVRTREHIDVAKMSGANTWSILGRDVLPYLLSYVVMAFVLQVSGAILYEATLSLLGLGPSGSISLGTMLYWAQAWGSVRTGAWWAFMPPTLLLTLIAFSLLLLQSSLDEVFNPRLRRGKGRKKAAEAKAGPLVAPIDPTPSPVGATGIVETPVSAQTTKGEIA